MMAALGDCGVLVCVGVRPSVMGAAKALQNSSRLEAMSLFETREWPEMSLARL